MIDPQGQKIGPAGARNGKKATVKIWRTPIRQQTDEVQKFFLKIYFDAYFWLILQGLHFIIPTGYPEPHLTLPNLTYSKKLLNNAAFSFNLMQKLGGWVCVIVRHFEGYRQTSAFLTLNVLTLPLANICGCTHQHKYWIL